MQLSAASGDSDSFVPGWRSISVLRLRPPFSPLARESHVSSHGRPHEGHQMSARKPLGSTLMTFLIRPGPWLPAPGPNPLPVPRLGSFPCLVAGECSTAACWGGARRLTLCRASSSSLVGRGPPSPSPSWCVDVSAVSRSALCVCVCVFFVCVLRVCSRSPCSTSFTPVPFGSLTETRPARFAACQHLLFAGLDQQATTCFSIAILHLPRDDDDHAVPAQPPTTLDTSPLRAERTVSANQAQGTGARNRREDRVCSVKHFAAEHTHTPDPRNPLFHPATRSPSGYQALRFLALAARLRPPETSQGFVPSISSPFPPTGAGPRVSRSTWDRRSSLSIILPGTLAARPGKVWVVDPAILVHHLGAPRRPSPSTRPSTTLSDSNPAPKAPRRHVVLTRSAACYPRLHTLLFAGGTHRCPGRNPSPSTGEETGVPRCRSLSQRSR